MQYGRRMLIKFHVKFSNAIIGVGDTYFVGNKVIVLSYAVRIVNCIFTIVDCKRWFARRSLLIRRYCQAYFSSSSDIRFAQRRSDIFNRNHKFLNFGYRVNTLFNYIHVARFLRYTPSQWCTFFIFVFTVA